MAQLDSKVVLVGGATSGRDVATYLPFLHKSLNIKKIEQ